MLRLVLAATIAFAAAPTLCSGGHSGVARAQVASVLPQLEPQRRKAVPFATLGPLSSRIDAGQSGPWTVTDNGGAATLANADGQRAVRFYSTDWAGDLAAGRSVSVRAQASGTDGLASAGLILRVTQGDPRWIAYVVDATGKLGVYVRGQSTLDRTLTLDIPGGHRADGDVLSVNQRGTVAQLVANGYLVRELRLDGGQDPNLAAPVGIVALGQGRFTLSDFGFGPIIVPRAAPPVADTGTGTDQGPAPGPVGEVPATRLTAWTLQSFGGLFGIFAHEFGHFMIGELKLPSTGPEEDVADEFAAMVWVANLKTAPRETVSMAQGTAKLWWFLAEDRGDNATPFYDEHAPDRARFAKYACYLYGASPDDFNDLMDLGGIPDRTKKRCISEEPRHYEAWQKLLTPYRRRDINPDMPGSQDPSTPGHTITVVYQPTKKPELQKFAQEIQDSHIFDAVADAINKLYVLPRDTKIVFRDCNMQNCFYNSGDGSVTMCWEMISLVLNEFRKNGVSPTQPNGPPTPVTNSNQINQYLVGIWKQTIQSDGAEITFAFKLARDNSFVAILNIKKEQTVEIKMQGTWAVRPVGGRTELSFNPDRFDPPSAKLNPIKMMVEVVDRNSFRTGEGMVRRIE